MGYNTVNLLIKTFLLHISQQSIFLSARKVGGTLYYQLSLTFAIRKRLSEKMDISAQRLQLIRL